jgi:hypothetical protein
VQKSTGKILASGFWDGLRRHPPQIIFQRAKLSTRSILISAGVIEGHFEGKRRGNLTKVVLFLHDNVRSHWALATQKKLFYLGFHFLEHPSYSPDLTPPTYHLYLGLIKIIE